MNEILRARVNGRPGDGVSVHDRGFQYGDGVFETLAVRQGRPLLWEPHLARLRGGARRLGFDAPAGDFLEREARAICEGVARGVLKLVVTRGTAERGYRVPAQPQPATMLTLSPWPDAYVEQARAGSAVRVCRTRLAPNPSLAGMKHLNRLEQVLARAEWNDEYGEGLMLDTAGLVVSGTATNVYAVINGTLYMPDLSRCGVQGVMRGFVMAQARVLGIPWREGPLTLGDLRDATEIFLSNSVVGIMPVIRVEDRGYPVGEITRTFQRKAEESGAIA